MFIIETPRLLFRPLTPGDAEDLAAIYADPDVMLFFEGTRSLEHAVREIEECRRWYVRLGFHFWATIHKEDRKFIGRCGLLPQVLDGRREVEVAYMLARRHWNQGLGTEAARAITEYGFERHTFRRLVSIIAPSNLASIRVAEKNGMRYIKDVAFKGYVDRLYAVERPSS
jgi:ribosomal-protein-alanine N-acetyltransferase